MMETSPLSFSFIIPRINVYENENSYLLTTVITCLSFLLPKSPSTLGDPTSGPSEALPPFRTRPKLPVRRGSICPGNEVGMSL